MKMKKATTTRTMRSERCHGCVTLSEEIETLKKELVKEKEKDVKEKRALVSANEEMAKSNAKIQQMLSEVESKFIASLSDRESALQRIARLESDLAKIKGEQTVLAVSLPAALQKASSHEVSFAALKTKCEVLEYESSKLMKVIISLKGRIVVDEND